MADDEEWTAELALSAWAVTDTDDTSDGDLIAWANFYLRGMPAEEHGEFLARLAQDRNAAVRAHATAHPACPPDVLAGLITDPNPAVQRAVLSRDCQPPGAATYLQYSEYETVRDRARELLSAAGSQHP